MEYDGIIGATCSINTPLETIVSSDVTKISCKKCLSIYLKMPLRELEELPIHDIQESLAEALQASNSLSMGD